jgi:hypothetical protein
MTIAEKGAAIIKIAINKHKKVSLSYVKSKH